MKLQRNDSKIHGLYVYLEQGTLPPDEPTARHCVLESSQFTIIDGVLYHCDRNRGRTLCVVDPQVLCQPLL